MGGLSTGAMFGLYVLLNMVLVPQWAYFIAYVITVIVSYFLNTIFVFKTEISWQSFFAFPLVYVVQYTLSAIILQVMVHFDFSVTYSPLLIILFLLPLTFLMSRVMVNR